MNNPMQYHVVLTQGNTEKSVKVFDDKAEAIDFGQQFFSTLKPGDGVVTVEGIAPGNPNRRIVDGWHF